MNRQHGRVPVAGVRDAVAALVEAPDLADGPAVDGPPHLGQYQTIAVEELLHPTPGTPMHHVAVGERAHCKP